MKRTAFTIFAFTSLLLILGSGCGDRTLTLNVDVLSFLEPSTVAQVYGDDPPIPPFAILPVVIDSDVEEVNLSEGLSDLTDVERVDLYISTEFANETGSAEVEFMVFVSDTLTKPYDDNIPADRYVHEFMTLAPGTIDTLHAAVLGDEELGELLTSKATKIGIRMKFDSSGSSQSVTGVATIIRFDATVVARRHTP